VAKGLLLCHPSPYLLHPPPMNSPQAPKRKRTLSPAHLSPRCRITNNDEAEDTNLSDIESDDKTNSSLVGH
jgi:hypothetical protein